MFNIDFSIKPLRKVQTDYSSTHYCYNIYAGEKLVAEMEYHFSGDLAIYQVFWKINTLNISIDNTIWQNEFLALGHIENVLKQIVEKKLAELEQFIEI